MIALNLAAFVCVTVYGSLYGVEQGAAFSGGFVAVALLFDFHRWLLRVDLQYRINRAGV